MPRPDDFGNLEEFEYIELGQIADKFAHVFAKLPGQHSHRRLLAGWPARLRLAVTCELVKIELENRWQRGKQIYLEDYLNQFPELKNKRRHFPARLRRVSRSPQIRAQSGLDEFQSRFPSITTLAYVWR